MAITNLSGIIIDTFQYDTYGKLISRTGSSSVIFLYNGRDGVVTDSNGLIYMRARYYSPSLRRFINADIVAGEISNAITLNRFAYANGNPVSFIDPFGLSAERGNSDPLYEQLSAMTYEERLEWLREEIKNNPEKYLTYQGNSNSKATSPTSDREKYIYQNAQNALYELLKSWGISLTKTLSKQSFEVLNAAGVTIQITIDVSFETPWDTNVKSDFSTSSGYSIHEAKTPEIKLFGTNFGAQLGVYVDEERLSVGTSSYSSIDGWEYSSKRQMGVYSEAYITSVSYVPDDKYLPTVTVTLDYEIDHLTKIVGGGLIAAAVVAPQLTFAAVPTLSEFIQQLGSFTPAFAH